MTDTISIDNGCEQVFGKGYIHKPRGMHKILTPIENSVIDHILDCGMGRNIPAQCGLRYLARIYKCSDKSIKKALNNLIFLGFIRKVGGSGGPMASRYVSNIRISSNGRGYLVSSRDDATADEGRR